MRVRTLLTVVCWAFAGLLMVPMMSTSTASAAQLAVTAGPLQTWRIVNGLPEPALPPALVALAPGRAAVTAVEAEPSGHEDTDDQVSAEPAPDAAAVVPDSPVPTSGPADSPDPTDPVETPAPAPGTPAVDLSDCGDLEDYDEVVWGTPGDDHLVAGEGRQVLVGLGGDDTLSGGDGEDCLIGGAGDDEISGDPASDVIDGGAGDDQVDPDEAPQEPATEAPEAQPTDPTPSPEAEPSPAGFDEAGASDAGQPAG